ncbi:putative lipoprotein [Dehalogenimonas lykanthroporepellens BL-DC-9]|nr:putative lipoprotein [Dehalogenimonas lykanthroporepellens BL-DC-9]
MPKMPTSFRFLFIFAALILVAGTAGCGPSAEENTDPTTPSPTTSQPAPSTTPAPTTQGPYSNYYGYLLTGYPEDIWPLYESAAIESCTLDVQYPAYNNGYNIYRNIYYVLYKTEAAKEDIAEYYNSLLAQKEESSYYDAIGVIDGYEVTVRVDDSISPATVYISVTLPRNHPMVSNPLLEDFPEDRFPLYELNTIWAETFNVNSNQPSGEQFSDVYFSHSGNRDEALEFYRDLFEGAEGYEEETVDSLNGKQTTLSGNMYDYEFSIVIGVWGYDDMIEIRLGQPQG